MIDLNALTVYKEKIRAYLDENAPDISTTSNILNMFKIKNYTGNGIEPHGSVKIDENGIATGFRQGNYILTGLSADILNTDNFELQTKFKLSSLRPSNGMHYIWAATCDSYDPPRCNLFSTGFTGSKYGFHGLLVYNGSDYLYSYIYMFPYTDEEQIKNAIVDKWFVLNQKFSKDNVETTLIDENDKVLNNKITTFKYRPKDTLNGRKYICFGNISNIGGQPTNITYDLSECYIKIDDELVSNWNM